MLPTGCCSTHRRRQPGVSGANAWFPRLDVGGRLRLDLVQEPDELLMAVALHAAADLRSDQNIERRTGRSRRGLLIGSPGWLRSRTGISRAGGSR